MTISASMVRELRERSGAGMMECKKALEATGGDIEEAFDHLRKAGLRTAAKKASRETAEGRALALVAEDGRSGAVVALACETDFVARTAVFDAFLRDLAEHLLANEVADVDALAEQPWKGGDRTVGAALQETIGKLGENMQIADARRLVNRDGRIGSYLHNNDKIAVIVSVTTAAPAEKADEVLKTLCMHIAFHDPAFLSRDEVPADEIEREKAVLRETEDIRSKPSEIQDKIIAGRLEKYFAERCLLEQGWVKDDKVPVRRQLEAELGGDARVEAYARVRIGG